MPWMDYFRENLPADLSSVLKGPGDFLITPLNGALHRIHYYAKPLFNSQKASIRTIDFDLDDWDGSLDQLAEFIRQGLKTMVVLDFALKGTQDETAVHQKLRQLPQYECFQPTADGNVADQAIDQYDILMARRELSAKDKLNLQCPVIDVVSSCIVSSSLNPHIRACQDMGMHLIEVDSHSNNHLRRLVAHLKLGPIPEKTTDYREKRRNPLMSYKKREVREADLPDLEKLEESEKENSSYKCLKV